MALRPAQRQREHSDLDKAFVEAFDVRGRCSTGRLKTFAEGWPLEAKLHWLKAQEALALHIIL